MTLTGVPAGFCPVQNIVKVNALREGKVQEELQITRSLFASIFSKCCQNWEIFLYERDGIWTGMIDQNFFQFAVILPFYPLYSYAGHGAQVGRGVPI